jgi:hypothetical protein
MRLLFIFLIPLFLYADFLYSFKNISFNYFDWDKTSQEEAYKEDFSYFELEGGFGYDAIEFYGFFNLENPLHSYNDDLRYVAFVDTDYKLFNEFRIHFQAFNLNSHNYYVNDPVLGVSYKFVSNFGLWFRPFLGFHYTYDTYYKGLNGYMGGWLFSYDFKIASKKFNIFNWNEIEFGRKKEFYQDSNSNPIGDGDSWGLNGAVSGWFFPTDSLSLGVQYRYAKNKLGKNIYQSGVIYSIKYYF